MFNPFDLTQFFRKFDFCSLEFSAPSHKQNLSAPTYKHERIVVPVAVDSTQQEALSILKKLKVFF